MRSRSFTAAISSFGTSFSGYAGTKYVLVMLGTNDARSAFHTSLATFQANLASCCTALISAGYTPVLHYPPYFTDGGGSGLFSALDWAYALNYQTAISNIVNGSTILIGDVTGWDWFADHPTQLTDGVHPTQTGATSLGGLWALRMNALVNPSGGGNRARLVNAGGG